MARKVLIVTGDAGESYDTLYAKHRIAEAGFTPVIASTRKGPLNLVMHDFEPGWDTYVERAGYKVSADVTFKEVKVADYVAVLLLGGRAPEYLRNDATLLRLVREFADGGKFVSRSATASRFSSRRASPRDENSPATSMLNPKSLRPAASGSRRNPCGTGSSSAPRPGSPTPTSTGT